MRTPPASSRPSGHPEGDVAADTAATPQRTTPSRRHVLRRSIRRKPTAPDILAALVFALAGSMFVAGARASGGEDLRVDRTGGLRETIVDLAEVNEALQARVDDLTGQAARLRASVPSQDDVSAVQGQADELAPQVGLTEVTGPGLTVTLTDAPTPPTLPDGFTGDDYLVHQQDVQGVVNALWRGGASGVTIMGQRLISSSAVRCVGNTVILQGRVYSPPFVIAAVGDAPRMQAALEADPAVSLFRGWAGVVGLGYSEVESPSLTLPPYSGPLGVDHTEAVS